MSWIQHVLTCAEAATFTGEDVHPDRIVYLCEAQGESGWADGGVAWASHAPSIGAPGGSGSTVSTEDRANPGLDTEDWTAATQGPIPKSAPRRGNQSGNHGLGEKTAGLTLAQHMASRGKTKPKKTQRRNV